ncbi:apolipoprotein N-acyltransferase [Segnochrobactrum spirostomi]|uniref:apolipoprotein N-acyltransferase n=1 Tax=Segnochrobactrum spirostomi TaxID=2608987 RepID=UPI0028AEB736|nr:apolipoprotein N-acyltransferase [Segnochrobactrum spirostomi]
MLAGALGALAQAPVHAFPVLWLSFPLLVLLIDPATDAPPLRRLRAAAWVGWCYGFGYFLAGLWWIGSAFLVDAAAFAWLIPVAVTALPAGLALFMALGTAVATLLWRPGPWRIAGLAVALTGSEWLRGHILTGFPWLSFGYGLAATDTLMQTASLVGLNGLTFLAVLLFAAPAAALGRQGRPRDGLAFVGATLLGLAGLAAFGAIRLASANVADVPDVRLRLVQPAIDQALKWLPENRLKNFEDMLALSRGPAPTSDTATADPAADPTTLVVWPETATPFALADDGYALAAAGAAIGPKSILAAGSVRVEPGPDPTAEPRYFNSLLFIDPSGAVRSLYDKVHLVPFGEYVPFQGVLGALGLGSLSNVVGGFSAGTDNRLITLPGLPAFEPLICYEIIFPDEVLAGAARGQRPAFFLNVTNDAWFGDTAGPYQHFAQARLRAVEQGIPLVRDANTGISAIVDGYGKVRQFLPLGARGAVEGPLPGALASTIYGKLGNFPLVLICAIIVICSITVRLRRLH